MEGDRDMSDSDDIQNSRYRSYSSHPTSRRSSVDLSPDGTASAAAATGDQQQRPALMVRRVGSRQMLVLGDEASIHGKTNFLIIFRFKKNLYNLFINSFQVGYQRFKNGWSSIK